MPYVLALVDQRLIAEGVMVAAFGLKLNAILVDYAHPLGIALPLFCDCQSWQALSLLSSTKLNLALLWRQPKNFRDNFGIRLMQVTIGSGFVAVATAIN